jgi:protein-disulfide isomerase
MEAAAAGIVLSAVGSSGAKAQQLTQQDVFFDPDAPVLGNPKGDVTIVEFFDYQCPYCKKAHPDVKQVVREDGNVRYIMKDWPVFGDASVFASQAALGAVELGLYEAVNSALMATPGALTEEDVKKIIVGAGADLQQLGSAVNANFKKISALLERNYNQALAFNFSGTPSFVIGNALYAGLLDKDTLRGAIRSARAT